MAAYSSQAPDGSVPRLRHRTTISFVLLSHLRRKGLRLYVNHHHIQPNGKGNVKQATVEMPYQIYVPTAPVGNEVLTNTPFSRMLNGWVDSVAFSTISTLRPSGVLNATLGSESEVLD